MGIERSVAVKAMIFVPALEVDLGVTEFGPPKRLTDL
jgi:hypothetical protein